MGSITTFPAQAPAITAQGTFLGYAQVTTSQTGVTTAAVDLTGLVVTVTVPEGRRIRISSQTLWQKITTAGYIITYIMEGTTQLGEDISTIAAASYIGHHAEVIITPTAGTHTYKLRALCSGDTADMNAAPTLPAYILVEDITNSPQPYPSASVPVGVLGQAIFNSGQTVGTSVTTLTGSGVNVVVTSGRTIKLTAGGFIQNNTAGVQTAFRIRRDGVVIQDGQVDHRAAGVPERYHLEVTDSPPAGAHTYDLEANTGGGTATIGGAAFSTWKNYLIVEDVTPTPAAAVGAPSSTLGYAEVTTNQTAIGTTEVDATGLSVQITVPAGRRVMISARVPTFYTASTGLDVMMALHEDGVQIALRQETVTASMQVAGELTAVRSPSAGTHTYKLRVKTTTGTINLGAGTTYPAFILVEDITGVGFPPYTVAIQPTSQTLAYAEVSASQTIGAVATETDINGASVTVTVPAGRRLRISAQTLLNTSVANDEARVHIKEGTNYLQTAIKSFSGALWETYELAVIVSPAAGTHTYFLRANRQSGTGSLATYAAAQLPTYILVEDITGGSPVADPVSVPVGVLAQAIRTTNFTTTSGTFTDIPGFSLNVAVPAGRLLKVNLSASVYSTVAGDSMTVRLYRDGVMIRAAADPDLEGNWTDSLHMEVLDSPSAGSHVYTAQINRGAGTGTVNLQGTSSDPALFWIEDVTPTPAPSTGAPGSTLAYAEITANQTGITTEVDITGLAATVTVPAGRRLRITGSVLARPGVANDELIMVIREGGTQLQAVGQTLPNTARDEQFRREVVVTPTAGTHTYRLALVRSAGTGAAQVTAGTGFPSFILIEDITGSVWPTGSAVTAGMVASEAWTEWTPVFTQGVAVTFTRQRARYSKIGRQVTADFIITFTSTGTAGQGVILTLPVPAAVSNNFYPIGVASFYSAGTKYWLMAEIQSGGTVRFQYATGTTDAVLGVAAPFSGAVVSGQIMAGTISYEAAS